MVRDADSGKYRRRGVADIHRGSPNQRRLGSRSWRVGKLHATANPQLDLNGDGVIDERDVTMVAARAVKLEKGGHL